MGSTPRWMVVAIAAAMLTLGACSTTGPMQARGEPALRFSSPADAGSESRDDHDGPDRVRRDAHGRPIYFREVPFDRHGDPLEAGAGPDEVCEGRNRCHAEDGARNQGSDDR